MVTPGNPVNAGTAPAAGKRGASHAAIGAVIGLLAGVVIAVALFSSGFIGADRDGGANPSSVASDSAEEDADAVSSSEEPPATSSGGEGGANTSTASSEAAREKPVADSTAPSSVLETESMRITMPSSLAAQGYQWSGPSNESAVLEDANGSVLAVICWGEAATRGGEAKSESYEIGVVSHGSIGFPAYLRLNYLDSEGKSIYWGRDEEGTLATDYLGIDLQDFVSWIELWHVNEFRPATLKESGSAQAGDSDDDGSSLREPFYGVWVSASKDYDEAQAMADELGGAGFAGCVFVTTDWDNLNPEPWYVVSAGYAKTESEAQSLCDRVHEAGYGDAYVKYSGDYIGEQ